MFLLHYCLQIFQTAVESVKMLGCLADTNMAAFLCEESYGKWLFFPFFSHPAGHSCDQKATSILEKASFSVPIGGLLFYRGTFYLTYLKRS